MDSVTQDPERFGLWDGFCAGCDGYGRVDDVGLCTVCAAKMERDMIRRRDWAYSAAAYGCPPEKREALRVEVIRDYGKKLELLANSVPARGKRESRQRTLKRKKR